MARSKNNVVMHGMSGKIGDMLVFKQWKGQTIVANVPKQNDKPATAAQKAVQTKFQQAVIYGSGAMKNPTLAEAYTDAAHENQTGFNIAVADFFNAPDIQDIDFSGYHGHVGDLVIIRVVDDFKVETVQVHIENPDGSLVEEGNAVVSPDGVNWIYTATHENASLVGDKITVTAKDLPKNQTTQDSIIS